MTKGRTLGIKSIGKIGTNDRTNFANLCKEHLKDSRHNALVAADGMSIHHSTLWSPHCEGLPSPRLS